MRPVWAALTLSVMLFTACNVPVEQVPEAPPVPEVQTANPAQGAPWQQALAKLPFEVLTFAAMPNANDTPLGILGTGLVTPDEVLQALASAGISTKETSVTVTVPSNITVNSETVPLRFEVLPVQNAQSGQPVWIRVRIRNLSAKPIELTSAAWSFVPFLLDAKGQPVRWMIRSAWTTAQRRTQVPANGSAYIEELLILDQFNPNLPLPGGTYQPQMIIRDVTMIVSASDTRKIQLSVTGPSFTISP